jgi:hypothetical protein
MKKTSMRRAEKRSKRKLIVFPKLPKRTTEMTVARQRKFSKAALDVAAAAIAAAQEILAKDCVPDCAPRTRTAVLGSIGDKPKRKHGVRKDNTVPAAGKQMERRATK